MEEGMKKERKESRKGEMKEEKHCFIAILSDKIFTFAYITDQISGKSIPVQTPKMLDKMLKNVWLNICEK